MTIAELFNDIKHENGCMDFDNFYQVWFEEDVDDIEDANDVEESDIRNIQIGWHNCYEGDDYFETLGEFFDEGEWANY